MMGARSGRRASTTRTPPPRRSRCTPTPRWAPLARGCRRRCSGSSCRGSPASGSSRSSCWPPMSAWNPVVAEAESLGMRPAVRLRQGVWRDGRLPRHDLLRIPATRCGSARLGDPGPGIAAAGEPVATPKAPAPRRDDGGGPVTCRRTPLSAASAWPCGRCRSTTPRRSPISSAPNRTPASVTAASPTARSLSPTGSARWASTTRRRTSSLPWSCARRAS